MYSGLDPHGDGNRAIKEVDRAAITERLLEHWKTAKKEMRAEHKTRR